MRLFQRPSAADAAPVPGLAESAAASGWQPAPDPPIDPDMKGALHGIALDMHRINRGIDSVGPTVTSRMMAFYDAFRFNDSGRTLTVANARAILDHTVRYVLGPVDVALCAVELPTLLRPGVVSSRRYHLRLHVPATPTGNPAFDERYEVSGMPASVGGTWLTPQVQQLILAHDDWVLYAFGATLVCLSKDRFATADDVVRRTREVLQLVAAIPTSVVPAQADHSVDDLAARIARIDSIEEALAFLQQLTDADRERLAQSDTPLADFADVRTPDEAMLRMQSLPPARQMQLMAMFMH